MTTDRKGECEGDRDRCQLDGCPLFGVLGRPYRDGRRRVRGCGDPAARGKRNRAKGDSKARTARRKLGLAGVNSRHEELWRGRLRVEVKAGAQVSPIVTRFESARRQSDEAKAFGDTRPFAMVAMPDGSTTGVVLMTLDEFGLLLDMLEGVL